MRRVAMRCLSRGEWASILGHSGLGEAEGLQAGTRILMQAARSPAVSAAKAATMHLSRANAVGHAQQGEACPAALSARRRSIAAS